MSTESRLDDVIPVSRPRRVVASLPDHLLRDAEASARATATYARVLHGRFELARESNNRAWLGRLPAGPLHEAIAASTAFQATADTALMLIERDLAMTARMAAIVAGDFAPPR